MNAWTNKNLYRKDRHVQKPTNINKTNQNPAKYRKTKENAGLPISAGLLRQNAPRKRKKAQIQAFYRTLEMHG